MESLLIHKLINALEAPVAIQSHKKRLEIGNLFSLNKTLRFNWYDVSKRLGFRYGNAPQTLLLKWYTL